MTTLKNIQERHPAPAVILVERQPLDTWYNPYRRVLVWANKADAEYQEEYLATEYFIRAESAKVAS